MVQALVVGTCGGQGRENVCIPGFYVLWDADFQQKRPDGLGCFAVDKDAYRRGGAWLCGQGTIQTLTSAKQSGAARCNCWEGTELRGGDTGVGKARNRDGGRECHLCPVGATFLEAGDKNTRVHSGGWLQR